MPPPPEPKEEKEIKTEPKVRRRMDTPLAAMLPSKYVDVDVTDLFPDFRYDKVLAKLNVIFFNRYYFNT